MMGLQQAVEAYHTTRDGESIPGDMMDRMLDGETPLRVWRDHRGLALQNLAEAASVSVSYLSEIETGKKDGSIRVRKIIAGILRVDIDDLV